MSFSETPLKTVAFLHVPPALTAAITGHWKGKYSIAGPDSAQPDLIVTADESLQGGAIPVLRLEKGNRSLNLRRITHLAEDMIAAPALYLDDLNIGDAVLRPQEKILSWREKDIALTDKEVDIIVYLARLRGVPVPRPQLLLAVWGYQSHIDTHTLETHIYRLRQKIGDNAGNFIVTDEKGYLIP